MQNPRSDIGDEVIVILPKVDLDDIIRKSSADSSKNLETIICLNFCPLRLSPVHSTIKMK